MPCSQSKAEDTAFGLYCSRRFGNNQYWSRYRVNHRTQYRSNGNTFTFRKAAAVASDRDRPSHGQRQPLTPCVCAVNSKASIHDVSRNANTQRQWCEMEHRGQTHGDEPLRHNPKVFRMVYGHAWSMNILPSWRPHEAQPELCFRTTTR
jgi:hypothetical protein